MALAQDTAICGSESLEEFLDNDPKYSALLAEACKVSIRHCFIVKACRRVAKLGLEMVGILHLKARL